MASKVSGGKYDSGFDIVVLVRRREHPRRRDVRVLADFCFDLPPITVHIHILIHLFANNKTGSPAALKAHGRRLSRFPKDGRLIMPSLVNAYLGVIIPTDTRGAVGFPEGVLGGLWRKVRLRWI